MTKENGRKQQVVTSKIPVKEVEPTTPQKTENPVDAGSEALPVVSVPPPPEGAKAPEKRARNQGGPKGYSIAACLTAVLKFHANKGVKEITFATLLEGFEKLYGGKCGDKTFTMQISTVRGELTKQGINPPKVLSEKRKTAEEKAKEIDDLMSQLS